MTEFDPEEVCLTLTVSPSSTVHAVVVYDHPFTLYSQTQLIEIVLAELISETVILLEIYCVERAALETSVNEKLLGTVSTASVLIS